MMSSPTVLVYSNPETLGSALCRDIKEAAATAIQKQGAFYLAVPGGSVLKLLSGLTEYADSLDWSKFFLYYVNHKCVPMTDASATHLKAKKLFIDTCKIPASNVFSLVDVYGEVKGHDTDAHNYEKAMKSSSLPVDKSSGFPVFDFMLIGMGKDGHIGSLYAERKEVTENTSKWVLSIDKKTPPSITLSLPVMNGARDTRVVLMGADKAEAALIGITKSKAANDFPVCGIKSSGTTWMIDKPCSELVKAKIACIDKS